MSSGFNFGSKVNFGAPAPTNTTGQTPQAAPPNATAAGFGGGGFNFGGAKPASIATTTPIGLNFGGATSTPAGGLGAFSAATPTANTLGGLGAKTAATTSFSGFSAAGSGTTALGGFGAKTPASSTAGLSLGGLGAKTSTPAGLGFTSTPGSLGGGGFTATSTSAGGLGGLGATTATATNALGGGFGTTSTPALGGLLGGTTSTATTVTPTLGGGLAATTAAGSLGGMTGGGLKLTTSAAPSIAATTLSGFGATSSTVSSTTGTLGATSKPDSMNYRQLEENINKWTAELEDQEKIFLQQATQVNAWDRLLIDNGEKITQLNTDVEKVKLDQQRLDHELDFIQSQQTELEDMLKPLESAVEALPPISYQQHADLEREHTYQLAENIDGQLKRMVQDLTDIIEHLNSTNSKTDSNDPVQQIAKILNAHMDSLQWVDQNSVLLQKRVEDVAKQSEIRRKEQERNVRLAYK